MRTIRRIAQTSRPEALVAAVAALALAAALGCGGNTRDEAPVSRIADVPVPSGFKFVPDQSSDVSSGGVRIVTHQYKGGLDLPEVTAFYRRAMPTMGWSLQEQSFRYGRQRLVFDKGNERCYISIWDDWGTRLLIQVFPKGASPLETGSSL